METNQNCIKTIWLPSQTIICITYAVYISNPPVLGPKWAQNEPKIPVFTNNILKNPGIVVKTYVIKLGGQ